MAPISTFLMCSVLAAASEMDIGKCEIQEVQGDQTALLQSHLSRKGELTAHHSASLHFPSLNNLRDPKQRRSSLAQFEKTATNLIKDRSSITEGIVELANTIIAMLRGPSGCATDDDNCTPNLWEEAVVPVCAVGEDCASLGSIINEHDNDVALIASLFSQFDAYVETAKNLKAMSDAFTSTTAGGNGQSQTALANAHSTCRATENTKCVEAGECFTEQALLQDEVLDQEELLREKDEEINKKWCDLERCDTVERDGVVGALDRALDGDGQGTGGADCGNHLHETFRSESKELMKQYIAILADLVAAQALLDSAKAACTNVEGDWTTQRGNCNVAQINFQSATCSHEQLMGHDIDDASDDYDQAIINYEQKVVTAKIDANDRKVEWTTIRSVICLLNELSIPSADLTNENHYNEALIAACHSLSVNTDFLDIHSNTAPNVDFPDPVTVIDKKTCEPAYIGHWYGSFGTCTDLVAAGESAPFGSTGSGTSYAVLTDWAGASPSSNKGGTYTSTESYLAAWEDLYNTVYPIVSIQSGNIGPATDAGGNVLCECESNIHFHLHTGSAFPYSMTSYALVNSQMSLGAAVGNFNFVPAVTTSGGTSLPSWSVTTALGASMSGTCTALVSQDLTKGEKVLLSLDPDSDYSSSWCYPDADYVGQHATQVTAEVYSQPTNEQMALSGGFVYSSTTGGSVPVALKLAEPWTFAASTSTSTYVLHWSASPTYIEETVFSTLCGSVAVHVVTTGRLTHGGAEQYCWAVATSPSVCEKGCFAFKLRLAPGTQTLTHVVFGSEPGSIEEHSAGTN